MYYFISYLLLILPYNTWNKHFFPANNWCCFLLNNLNNHDCIYFLNSLPGQMQDLTLTVKLKHSLFCRCYRTTWSHKNAVQPLLVVASRRSDNRPRDKDLTAVTDRRISSNRKDQHTPTPPQLSSDSPASFFSEISFHHDFHCSVNCVGLYMTCEH